jgi:hypothetical protein
MASALSKDNKMFSWRNLHEGKPADGAIDIKAMISFHAGAREAKKLRRAAPPVSPEPPKRQISITDMPGMQEEAFSSGELFKAKQRSWNALLAYVGHQKVLDKGKTWFHREEQGEGSEEEPQGVPDKRRKKASEEEEEFVVTELEKNLRKAAAEAYGIALSDDKTPKAKKKAKKLRKPSIDASIGMSRHVYYQRRNWDKELKEFLCGKGGFIDKLEPALITLDRKSKLLGKEVKYGARGHCSRCRRMTCGYSSSTSSKSPKPNLANYVHYDCECKDKRVNHCIRCICLEYLVEAKRIYGDCRVKDADGKTVSFREIPCLGKCGVDWSPSTMYLVGPPSATQLKAERSRSKSQSPSDSPARESGEPALRRRKKRRSKTKSRRGKK